MAVAGNATPLISLDAYAIDTETTGLDPARARIVEFGVVPLINGKLDEGGGFRMLINPGEPIPASATAIHNIADAMVGDAPTFAAVWPDIAARLSGAVLIGHTLGFDLAMIRRECERVRLAWAAPRTLDTQLLAQVAEPRLGSYTLESLASWLGLEPTVRHAALGDAILTARIFIALLPKLRSGKIRTLAEAEKACLALTSVLEDQHRVGWEQPVKDAARIVTGRASIDTYPYRHRVADVMSAPPKTITAGESLSAALRKMARDKVSSLLVTDREHPLVADVAIITERDVLRALADRGADALDMPVSDIASKPLATLPSAAFVYRALGRMNRLKVRHLAAEDEHGEVCGMVSARDLLRLRAQEVAILGDGVDAADDVPELGAAWSQLPLAAEGLVSEEVPGRDIAAVISRELGALTRRAAVLAERQMKQEGRGDPPCRYAFCVLGSAGRGESLLAMDQDNAIVFEDGVPGSDNDRWFARLGEIAADILHEVGVPYCDGGVMGRNEAWRGSLETWRARVDAWVMHSKPDDLMSVDIFFDLLAVHGDHRLANEIWRAGFEAAKGKTVFAKLLAETAGAPVSSITMLGGIRTENGRIDLKRAGLFGIVTLARVLAIRHGLLERATPARLDAVASLGRGSADLEKLKRAQEIFLDLILRQQLLDIRAGRPPSNKVEVKLLSRSRIASLKEALAAMTYLDSLMRDLIF